MANTVFSFRTYRDYLVSYVGDQEVSWGVLTKLSKAAGCHRPYLTKVIAGEAHLTSSQLFALAKYWQLSETQTEYLLRLLEIEKASQVDYRDYLIQKNQQLKSREEKLDRMVARHVLQPEAKNLQYYSSWIWSAVHMITSIPGFQTVGAISNKLNLTPSHVESVLSDLLSWGSVKRERGKWSYAGNEHHVPSHTPLVNLHHTNWRNQALVNSQRYDPNSVHFTVIQSVAREDYERIKQMVLELIKKTSQVANPSPSEQLYCFTCDLFEP